MADPDDAPPAAPRAANVGAVAILVAVLVGLLVWQRPWAGDDPAAAVPDLPTRSDRVVVEQLAALSAAETAADFRRAAGESAASAELADRIWRARTALAVDGIDFRRMSGGTVVDDPDGSTSVVVEVSWGTAEASPLGGTDSATARVRLRFLPTGDERLALTGVQTAGDLMPLWLAGEIDVRGGAGAVAISVDGGGIDAVTEKVEVAREQVERITGSDEPLVVVDPATAELGADLLGRTEAELAPIAGVATRLTGSRPLVLLNPDVFAAMDGRAAQVVVTHEATHAMTGAVGAAVEPWVSEGFADFVALRDDTAPLDVSAGQILEQVRTSGAPASLPSAADFDTGGSGLGAVYEGAWLIFRLIGETAPDASVVEFYTRVRDGADVEQALSDTLGTDLTSLTAAWRDYLTTGAS